MGSKLYKLVPCDNSSNLYGVISTPNTQQGRVYKGGWLLWGAIMSSVVFLSHLLLVEVICIIW